MAEMTRGKRRIAISVLRVLLGLTFLMIGVAKLTGSLHTVQTFEAFGWGQWLFGGRAFFAATARFLGQSKVRSDADLRCERLDA